MNIKHVDSSLSLTDIEHKLKNTAANHETLAKNIENADTPNYKALEVKEDNSFASRVRTSVNLSNTHPNHIQGKRTSSFKISKQKDAFQVKPNGNNVSLPQQAIKMSQNKIKHDTAIQAYRSSNELIIDSLGKAGQ